MIERLARALASLLPGNDGEQLADAFWLAAHFADSDEAAAIVKSASRDGVGSVPTASGEAAPTGTDFALSAPTAPATGAMIRVTEVGLRLPVLTPATQATATALSLFRRVHRPGRSVIDIDATVDETADARRLVVVTRPGHERGLDVAMVVDRTRAALAWAADIAELRGTLRRTGAFRSVSTWELDSNGSGENPGLKDNAGTLYPPEHIIDPAGRQLVLLFSDCTAAHWARPSTWRMLHGWAHAMPTVLVHLLPESYWGQTASGLPSAVVRSPRPAAPNALLEVHTVWWSDEGRSADRVPVPVIGLSPDAIGRWAQSTISGSTWIDAIWTDAPDPHFVDSGRLSEADQLRAFTSRASEGAQHLARILAGAPILSIPLMRVLHQRLVPDAVPGQMAELLASGLLIGTEDTSRAGDTLLIVGPHFADRLYQGTTRSEEWNLYDLLTEYLEQHVGPGDHVRALISDPHGTSSTLTSELVPFARMEEGLAQRLGISTVDRRRQPDPGRTRDPLEIASGVADTAIADASAARIAARNAAIKAKEDLCTEAEALAESTQWKSTGDRLKAIVDEWRTIRGIDRKTDDALWKRFSQARDTFTRRRGSHFAELDKQRGAAKDAKEELVKRAEALSDASDWGETAAKYRTLMDEWKATGRAPRDVEYALWARFRAAQEKFFSRRNKVFSDRDAEFAANAATKEKLLAEAEKIDPAAGLEQAKAKMRSIHDRWEAAGKVPRARIRELDQRLKVIEDRLNAADPHWRPTDPATAARVAQFRARVESFQAQAAKARAAGDERKAKQADDQARQWAEWLRTAQDAVER